jgi:hypothetical protein
MNRRNLRGRLDQLERAEPEDTGKPDWDALSRGDFGTWLASIPEQLPPDTSDPIEEAIARVGMSCGSGKAHQADEPAVRGKSGGG